MDALRLFYDEALRLLRGAPLADGYEIKRESGNLENVMKLAAGNSDKTATAWAKNKSKHAHLVEYGHRIVTSNGRDTGKRVPPHGWFRPALDAKRRDIRKAIAKGLHSLIMRKGFEDNSPDETGWIG